MQNIRGIVMISFLMLGSLVLGLIAWIFPVIGLMMFKKYENRNYIIFSILSNSACAISLCFQIFYNNYLVKTEDWSALMDTAGAVAFVSAVLLLGTILLNAITLIIYRSRTTR